MIKIQRFLRDKSDYIGVVFLAISFNSISIFRKFAWGDDWAFISDYRRGDSAVRVEHYSGYRPILQKIMDISFGNITNYEHLIFLRIFSVIGMAVLTVLVMKNLEKYGYSRLIKLTIGLGLNLLPTFWIYTNWSSTFVYPWVCVISILSLMLFSKNRYISVLLLVIAFMIYQPTAVFSVFLMFANYLRIRKIPRLYFKYFGTLILSACISLILSKFINNSLQVPAKARTGFLSDPIEIVQKIVWLVTRPLALSFRPFIVESHGIFPFALMAAGFLLSIAGLLEFSNKMRDLKFLAGIGIFYIFGLLPIIPIAENQIEFRILPTTSVMGLLLVLIGVQSLQKKIKLSNSFLAIIIIISITGTGLYSQSKIQEIFIKPFEKNRAYLLEKSLGNNLNEVIVVIDYNLTWPQRNYIGALSVISDFQMPWVPIGEVSQVLGIYESQIQIVASRPRENLKNALIIDLNQVRDSL